MNDDLVLQAVALRHDGRRLVLAFTSLMPAVLLPIGTSMAVEPGQDVYHTAGVIGEADDPCEQLNALKDDEKNQTSSGEFERQLLNQLRGWVDGYMTAMDGLQSDPSKRVANVHMTHHFEAVIERCRQYPWESVASATEAARRLLINEPVQSNEALSAGHKSPPPPPGWQRL